MLAGLSAGGELAAFAGTDSDGCWRPDRLPVEAEADGRLRGQTEFVLDGTTAAHLVVAARTPAGCDLFLVAGDAEGVQRRALETLDPTRAQASVSFDGAVGVPLTTAGRGAAAVAAGLDVALVVLAAEQVGGAAACLDLAVEYAKIRHQFSRPIGSFQAIKHKLADLLLLVEMGRSAVDRALLAEQDASRLAEAAAVAKIWCSDAYTTVATENVQVHGGHRVHLGARRAPLLPPRPGGRAAARRRDGAPRTPGHPAQLVTPGRARAPPSVRSEIFLFRTDRGACPPPPFRTPPWKPELDSDYS